MFTGRNEPNCRLGKFGTIPKYFQRLPSNPRTPRPSSENKRGHRGGTGYDDEK